MFLSKFIKNKCYIPSDVEATKYLAGTKAVLVPLTLTQTVILYSVQGLRPVKRYSLLSTQLLFSNKFSPTLLMDGKNSSLTLSGRGTHQYKCKLLLLVPEKCLKTFLEVLHLVNYLSHYYFISIVTENCLQLAPSHKK